MRRGRDVASSGTPLGSSFGRELGPTLLFGLLWLGLDTSLNVRYPGSEPRFWYLLPSVDLLLVFGCFVVVGQLDWRVPRAVRVGLVAWLFLVRVLRFGDGFQQHYYAQAFNLSTDLRLVPELVRFGFSTLKWWQFAAAILGLILAVVGFCVACYRALAYTERYLRDTKHCSIFGAATALVFLLSNWVGHDPRDRALYRIGFAASVMPRLQHETALLLNAYGAEASEAKVIARAEARLSSMRTDLAKLGGKNVHLILIESYGQTVLDRPAFVAAMRSTFDGFEQELGSRGFGIASNVLDSPTYGGHSWLAHATLGTGIRTATQLDYEVVCAEKPKAIAKFFNEAGYRTVVAQPGTTRPWPKGEFFGFEQKYYLWNFDYAGPSFSWATMPDQYLLDFVRRRELGAPSHPLFIEYVLVSSHAPWSELPPLVDDWSSVKNGALYNRLAGKHFPIVWPDFANASEAYIESIQYDFEVLKRYLADYIKDDSLVIILGDHQPVAEVNGHSSSHGIPIHVLSRSHALLQPFLARGYTAGMRPHRTGALPGLERFL
ncbi:MAG TPA: sulfatase-like hydrolase/transferase, partial [Polyangiaceae bacterium]